MADPYGLGFLGFPYWDTGGAILRDPAFYGQPQDISVYDLIARGYNPGDPNAFFSALPNLTTPAQVSATPAPQPGFFPASDYGYIKDLLNLNESTQNNANLAKLVDAGGSAATKLGKDFFSSPSVPAITNDTTPIDAFGAGVDFGSGPSALDSAIQSASDFIGNIGPYVPYAGALAQLGAGLASGTEEGLQSGLVQGAATVANTFLPGLGTALSLPLLEQIGPSKAWMSFPTRVGDYVTSTQNSAQGLSNSIAKANNFGDLYNALVDFRGNVGTNIPYGGQETMFTPWALNADKIMELDPSFRQQQGVAPDTSEPIYGLSTNQLSDLRQGNPELQSYLRSLETGDLLPQDKLFSDIGANVNNAIPDLPGATGSKHEGGISFDPTEVTSDLRNQLTSTVQSLYGQQYQEPVGSFATALASARTPQEITQALNNLYSGIGNGYGTGAPDLSSFGVAPSEDTLSKVIPDLPGLPDQSAASALRQELLSSYSGVVNKTNPFTGRGALPAPTGSQANNIVGSGGGGVTRIATNKTSPDALGSAIQDSENFITGSTGL